MVPGSTHFSYKLLYLLQVEFVRIDPFVRKTMTNKNGVISAKFMVRPFNTFPP